MSRLSAVERGKWVGTWMRRLYGEPTGHSCKMTVLRFPRVTIRVIYSDLRMRVPAKVSRNGTEIKCEAYSSSEVVFSNISWLWIMGKTHTQIIELHKMYS